MFKQVHPQPDLERLCSGLSEKRYDVLICISSPSLSKPSTTLLFPMLGRERSPLAASSWLQVKSRRDSTILTRYDSQDSSKRTKALTGANLSLFVSLTVNVTILL